MKKIIGSIVLITLWFSSLFVSGCTQQQRAKKFGGTATETLPAGKKLMVVTWKDNDLWILTREMKTNDIPETYEFIESSSFGVFQGKVIIKETGNR